MLIADFHRCDDCASRCLGASLFVLGSERSSNQTASPRAIRSDHPVSIPVASATPQHLAWAPDLSVSCQEGARFVLHSRIAVGVVVIEYRSRVDA